LLLLLPWLRLPLLLLAQDQPQWTCQSCLLLGWQLCHHCFAAAAVSLGAAVAAAAAWLPAPCGGARAVPFHPSLQSPHPCCCHQLAFCFLLVPCAQLLQQHQGRLLQQQ
jgi:hypothetical protein